jgi:hypothetical protein
MFYGFPQLNLENWNLSMVEPRHYAMFVNGYILTGTIVPSHWQGGNFWADYVPGSSLPYDEYGYIASGGDYFPYPIVAYSVVFVLSGHGSGTEWSVTVNGVNETTWGSVLVFYETPGSYSFTATVVFGHGSIVPSSGTVEVVDQNVVVLLHLHHHH